MGCRVDRRYKPNLSSPVYGGPPGPWFCFCRCQGGYNPSLCGEQGGWEYTSRTGPTDYRRYHHGYSIDILRGYTFHDDNLRGCPIGILYGYPVGVFYSYHVGIFRFGGVDLEPRAWSALQAEK